MRSSYLYLEAVRIITLILFNFGQVLDSELFFSQVIYSEQLNSIATFENKVVAPHHSLYRIYIIITDMIHLLFFLLIPHNHFSIIEPH
jgi:hypothetical protein